MHPALPRAQIFSLGARRHVANDAFTISADRRFGVVSIDESATKVRVTQVRAVEGAAFQMRIEVGELPAPVQVALLRVLQEHEFERVGGNETLRTDARIVAATNRNLEEAVSDARFRSDLFFRLNVFPIRVPALRERAEDVPLLAEYWAHRYGRNIGKAIRGIEAKAMEALCAYSWPGNIRELQNVVERAVILARGSTLGLSDFELPARAARQAPRPPSHANGGDERESIEAALTRSRGRVYGPEGAAEALGVPPSTLESRIRRLGIDKIAFRARPARD